MTTNTPAIDAQPVHDAQAEQSALGAMLQSTSAIADVQAHITPDDFWLQRHQAIARAIIELHAADEPTDPISVAAELDRRGELGRVGGAPYLHSCIEKCPAAVAAAAHARVVAEKAAMRKLAALGTHITQLGESAASGRVDVADVLAAAQNTIEDAITAATSTREEHPQRGLLQSRIMHSLDVRDGNVDNGIPTGFADLDDIVGGWRGGQLITVAARSGAGKSTLAVDFARSAALKHGQHVLYVSYEMGVDEIADRILCSEARIRLADLRAGRLSDEDLARASRRIGELSVEPGTDDIGGEELIHVIDDSPSLSEVGAIAQRRHRRGHLAMIIIDYVQIAPVEDGENVTRDRQIGLATQKLKQLARRLNVPVIMLSQLNRSIDNREDKRPRSADLRESGSIENDSDIVLAIHRPDLYERDDPRAGEADLILLKHRGGPTNTIAVAHQLHYCRFVDLAQE